MKIAGLFIVSVCLAECATVYVKELSGENLNYEALEVNENAVGEKNFPIQPTKFGNNLLSTLTVGQNSIPSSDLDFLRPQTSVSNTNEVLKPSSTNENVLNNPNIETVPIVSPQNSLTVSTNLQPQTQPQNPNPSVNSPQSPMENPIITTNNLQPQPENPTNINGPAATQTPAMNVQQPASSQSSSTIKFPLPPPKKPTASFQQPTSSQSTSTIQLPQPPPPPKQNSTTIIKLPTPPKKQQSASNQLTSIIQLPQSPPKKPTVNVQQPPSTQSSSVIKFPQPPPPPKQNLAMTIKLPTPPKKPNRPKPPTSVGQNRPRPPVPSAQG
uniref:Uncharacterized protein n=1 Tax=Zeugodacus cucurbitae TaxID=28588 RepID=A0A0A1XSI7_ZEUCU